jgi:Ca-activated chloride channel family protein
MNPSSRSGRSRLAPCRLNFPWTSALLLALACSHQKPVGVARPGDAAKPSATLESQTLASAAPVDGASTRAKGAEGSLGRAMPEPVEAMAPPSIPVSPAAPASKPSLAAGLGAAHAATARRVRAPSGSATGAPLRQMPSTQTEAERSGRPAGADTEAYAPISENPFVAVKEHPLSTFSSDVDTASYTNARRFLNEGQLPPQDSIRVEEWLNYFGYDYAPPDGEAPIAIHTEVSDCPWAASHRLVRIGVKSRPIEQANVPPRNLVFLVDVSGSMLPPNKLPLLKHGLRLLTHTLRPADEVAIVVYAGSSGLALPPTSGAHQDIILDALDALEAGGSTNGGEGIELAYRIATEQFRPGGINRVILATDGDFNVGTTSEGELSRLIESKRETGVFLTVLGFGEENVKDRTMELLADRGNGNYAYVDSASEARRVLVREAGATLVTVAKDVKLQVEWNPARVANYRLIGYENRLLADQDFNDDKKDAGDMGAGHAVTALYEVVPVGAAAPKGEAPPVSPLKYQRSGALAPAAAEAELLTVSVRYKAPAGDTSQKLVEVVPDRVVPFGSASADHRFAVAVAEFAQILRGSKAVRGLTLSDAERTASLALAADATGTRRELVSLIKRAEGLQKSAVTVSRAD